MKQILGNCCVDSVFVPHIYEDYPAPERLYGKGFTYTCILPVSAKPPPVQIDEIRHGKFDLIVYGSIHRGLPYWDEVSVAYPPERIVLLCGEDCDAANGGAYHECFGKNLADKGFHVFIRELA